MATKCQKHLKINTLCQIDWNVIERQSTTQKRMKWIFPVKFPINAIIMALQKILSCFQNEQTSCVWCAPCATNCEYFTRFYQSFDNFDIFSIVQAILLAYAYKAICDSCIFKLKFKTIHSCVLFSLDNFHFKHVPN